MKKEISCVQKGNRLEVSVADIQFFVEVQGLDLGIIQDYSFVLFMTVPFAMRQGFDIQCNLPVDPVVVKNAERLSEIWSIWMPDVFQPVSIRHAFGARHAGSQSKYKAYMFSGGVDSTYMISEEGTSAGDGVITIFGLDYKLKRAEAFARHLSKTAPFLEEKKLKQIVVNTDLPKKLGRLNLNHGFILAGVAFLFREHFSKVCLAADYNLIQQMVTFPWGTNFITNDFFKGDGFELETKNSDLGRAEKIASLIHHPTALRSLVFCGDGKHRPNNCGRCSKCVRTKAMFLLELEEVPDVFIDREFDKRHALSLNVEKRNEAAVINELLIEVKKRGLSGRLSPLPSVFYAAVRKKSVQSKKWARLISKSKKSMMWKIFKD